MRSKFNRIFLHCSDSEFGHAFMIDSWHKQRGFAKIGYHLCILNGYPTAGWWRLQNRIPYLDGTIEVGRSINDDEYLDKDEQGAHVYGHNRDSFAICMIGKNDFTAKQLNVALEVIRYHMNQFGISHNSVFGHYEFDSKKSCPNIDMEEFRLMLQTGRSYGMDPKETPKKEEQKPESKPAPKTDSRKELSIGAILKKIIEKLKGLL